MSTKYGAVWSDHERRYVNSPAFAKRKAASQRKSKAARRARRRARS